MYCKNCGKYIDDDSKFCKHCGTSLAITASVGVINTVTKRSGVLDIPSTTTVDQFIQMLFAGRWIPNDAYTISTVQVKPAKDKDYVMYESSGANPDNKDTLLNTLAEHNSDDVLIFYEEKSDFLPNRDIYVPRRPNYGDMVCLYGCPSSKKLEITCEVEKNEIESSIF